MNLKKLVTLTLFFLLSFSDSLYAQLVGDDLPYRVREIGNYRFVYSTEYESLTNNIVSKNSFFTELYEKEFNWVLDEDALLGLASSKNQITNGFATQYPRLWTLFYNGGPGAIDNFSVISWSDVLLAHESVHLYQLNVRRGLSTYMKKVLGGPATPFGFEPPFTFIITPHVFTPTFMIEGNATFNEGRFGNGGRLYSAYYRAMFLQLLKKDKLSYSRIINDHIEWPFTTEKYVVGGYFNSYLAEKFGAPRTNRFFFVHSSRYIWPFLMSDSFRDNYGQNFYELFDQFKQHYSELAKDQRELSGDLITSSHSHADFTVNGDVISFMVNDDSQGLNQLCLYHKTKRQLKCEKSLLPFERVFRHNKTWVSAAYVATHPTERRAGLFVDGYGRVDEFNDQFVYAKKGPHTVYADALNSFDRTRVYKNGQFVSDMQSSPHMDTKGNLYYFKQDGSIRFLYRNGQKLFSIKGFSGRVVDIGRNGTLYFTGATRSGMGLFSWDGRQMYQVLDSDRVFDAKLLDDEREALVAEITANGIETRVARFASRVGEPVFYEYEYDDPSLKEKLYEGPAPKAQALDYEYSPLLEMEYNGVTPIFGYVVPNGFIWNLNFQFNDPLQRYQSNLILADSGFESYSAQWILRSQMNRLQWTFSARYEQDAVTETTGPNADDVEVIGRLGETDIDLQFRFPFIQTPLWNSGMSLGYAYESINTVENLEELGTGLYENAAIAKFDFSYGFQNSLDYSASRFVGLELGYKYEGEGESWNNATPAYTAEVETQWDLFWQSFLKASYKAAHSDGPRRSIRLDDDDIPISFDPTDFFRLEDDQEFSRYLRLHKVNAEFKQAFMVRQYFSRFFVGLHRVAPFYGYSEFYGARSRGENLDTLFHESYYGMEFEILLFHKVTTRLKALEVESSLGFKRQEWLFTATQNF